MPSLLTTELAVVSVGTDIHLFYQNGQDIFETHSANGQAWVQDTTPIAKDGDYAGSAITAYYVDKDANFYNAHTIHLLYINSSHELVEKVKKLATNTWEGVTLEDVVKKGPEMNSRLAGAAYNFNGGWNPEGSQWVYYTSRDTTDAKEGVTEIRRTPSGSWNVERVLPQKWGQILLATSLAVTIVRGEIQLFFQNHDLDICLYKNTNNSWSDEGAVIKGSLVAANTTLSATKTSDGKTHIFYASKNSPQNIIHSVDGAQEELVKFYPGSKVGTTSSGDKVSTFYRSLNPVGNVEEKKYEGGKWGAATTVIKE
ncbi:developmental-specific protein Ssp1 [Sclerotinia borealis F-4128]|uniref:Developmental-specific protein Ssp1 n=1 Tax=Sclerotinia borealis (strain F-4128) TaxID=1432307 RepID=W9CPA5_SCLBF|nr:developmental-specific protein Ssp1 [Sclerotinia borealis F-4128]